MTAIEHTRPTHPRRATRTGWAQLLLSLSACAGSAPPVPASTQVFDPIAFFSQPTRGEGRLKIALRPAVAFHVEGRGVVDAAGTLHLAQTVTEQGKPPTHREWSIRRDGDGSYRGTLSDASGPVVVTVAGPRVRIRFAMRHGLAAEQWLVLAPDGAATQNRMTVRKFGVVVARVDERIVRAPQAKQP